MTQIPSLYEKIFGCLVGGALGDAFGIRVEMMHYKSLPPAWVDQVLRLNPEPDLTALARDLYDILVKNARDKGEIVQQILITPDV